MLSLLRIPLTILRSQGGEYDSNRNFVDKDPKSFCTMSSIQPYRKGKDQVVLPEGIRSEDVLVVWTKDELRVADQFKNLKADETTVDGREYVTFYVSNWNRHGLSIDHYEAILVRKDKAPNGSL